MYQFIQLRHLVTMTSHNTFHNGHLAITVIVRGPDGDRYGQVLAFRDLPRSPLSQDRAGKRRVESGPLPIDESVASPRPMRPRVESKNTSRRSRDSSASSRSSPRDVGRRVRHSSPDSVAGQEEAALPECRSRPRSRHARSTGDRRSSVDRRAAGLPVARSTGERRSSGDRRATRRPVARATGGPVDRRSDRRPVSRLPVDRRASDARSIGRRSIGGR